MSEPASPGRRRRRRRSAGGAKKADFWGDARLLGEADRIVPATDPTALLRSLGPPPLQRHTTLGQVYLEAVVHKASQVATALAATAGVLGEDEASAG